MIRHIVALRFRSDITPQAKAALYAELGGLSGRLDGILDFRTSPNVSTELPLTRGFDDVIWFDFRDAAARDAYLVDPEHKAIGGRLVAALVGGAEGLLVLDVDV